MTTSPAQDAAPDSVAAETFQDADQARCEGCGWTGHVQAFATHTTGSGPQDDGCPDYRALYQADRRNPLLADPHKSWLRWREAQAAEPETKVVGNGANPDTCEDGRSASDSATPAGRKVEASDRAQRIREGMGELAALMRLAVERKDHEALSYDTWADYIEGEFGEQRLPARRELVALLRAEGMSTRQIAEDTGLSQSAVQRSLPSTESVTDSVEPERVTGRDGRSRPARRPAAQRENARRARREQDTADPGHQEAADHGPDDLPPASMGPLVLREHEVHYRFAWEAFWWIAREVMTGKPRPEGKRADRVKIPEMPPWFPGRVEAVVTAMRTLQSGGKPVTEADTHPAALMAELEQARRELQQERAECAELTAARDRQEKHCQEKHDDCPGPAFDFPEVSGQ
jgi:hypothetical protein